MSSEGVKNTAEDETNPTEEESESFFADILELREMEHIYNAAIKQLTMKFEILNEEFRIKYARSRFII